jgi:hypothetical protein
MNYQPRFGSGARTGIEMNIVTDLETGESQIAVISGAETEEGKQAILKLVKEMNLDGMKLILTLQPEAHVHGPDKQAVLRNSRIRT